jgi:tetratricopeptide (TPR) repeat protein
MFAECPNCQQKLRPGWHHCPRCYMAIPQQPVAPAEEPAQQSRNWTWILVFGAIAAAGVASGAFTSSAPVTEAAVSRPQPARLAGLGPAADEGTASAYAALDAKHAGAASYVTGDLPGALARYEAAVAETPDDPDAQNNLGQILVRLGRAVDALPHFDAAVDIDDSRWSYRFNRARTYGLLNLWEQAVAEYRAAANLFPDDHATAYNLGLALMRVRNYPEAAGTLEHAVAMAPEETSFLITLGTAYVGAKQPDRARKAFEQFLDKAPADPEAPRVRSLLESMAAAGQ